MGKRVVEWSDLPWELLPMIGKSLDARVDVLRFRSVCTSWRSSIPPIHAHSPRFPLKFPEPLSTIETASKSQLPIDLCESTLYLIQPVNPFSTSSCCSKGWLIKVEKSKSGKLRLLDPLPNLNYIRSPITPNTPNTLNLLKFRVVELRKAYMLRFSYTCSLSIPWVNKVVMFPSSAWTDPDESAVFVIFDGGKLAFAKCGDEKWTLVGDRSLKFDDIIVYKGQLYAVDKLGNVWWVECSSVILVPLWPSLCGSGHQKHLVESCGALYVVDRYLPEEGRRTVDFKVHMLDEEERGWVLLESLGNRAFVLGNDCCFSVSAQELVGCKGNCIYFIEQDRSRVFSLDDRSRVFRLDDRLRVFSLDDHSIGDLAMEDDSHPFWKAPTWLSSANP